MRSSQNIATKTTPLVNNSNPNLFSIFITYKIREIKSTDYNYKTVILPLPKVKLELTTLSTSSSSSSYSLVSLSWLWLMSIFGGGGGACRLGTGGLSSLENPSGVDDQFPSAKGLRRTTLLLWPNSGLSSTPIRIESPLLSLYKKKLKYLSVRNWVVDDLYLTLSN